MPDDERTTTALPARWGPVQWWQVSAFTACNIGLVLGDALPASLRVALVAICIAAGLWALNLRYPHESIASGIHHYVSSHALHGLGRLLFVLNLVMALSIGDGRRLFFCLAAVMVFVAMAAPRPESAAPSSPE
jgi:hypothetical protein